MCIYRNAFVFKPISNQLNILVGCNLSFTKSLPPPPPPREKRKNRKK